MTTSNYLQSMETEQLSGRESVNYGIWIGKIFLEKVAPGQNFEGPMEFNGWKEILRPLRTFTKTQE